MDSARDLKLANPPRFRMRALHYPTVDYPAARYGMWWVVGYHPQSLNEVLAVPTMYIHDDQPPTPEQLADAANAARIWPLQPVTVYCHCRCQAKDAWRGWLAGVEVQA